MKPTTPAPAGEAVPAQVHQSNEALIALWVHGRSPHTQAAYRADVARFLALFPKPLGQVTLLDLQAFADHLAGTGMAASSQARVLSSIKSLLAFGHRMGALRVDVGRALRLPAVRQQLAQRILPERDTLRMLALEQHPRNRVLLRLLYVSGVRVSELCALRWKDTVAREEGGQLNVFGKGGRTRQVLVPASVWTELLELRGEATDEQPLFRSRNKGGALTRTQVWRIVLAAARRAKIKLNVSAHWLRHAHASHALDRGAPIHLVQATLGHASIATTGCYAHARPKDGSGRYLAV
jgi:integrase/recombinase XerD